MMGSELEPLEVEASVVVAASEANDADRAPRGSAGDVAWLAAAQALPPVRPRHGETHLAGAPMN